MSDFVNKHALRPVPAHSSCGLAELVCTCESHVTESTSYVKTYCTMLLHLLSAPTMREPIWISARWARSLFPKGANRATWWNSCCSLLQCPNVGPVQPHSSIHTIYWRPDKPSCILHDFHTQGFCMTRDNEQAFNHACRPSPDSSFWVNAWLIPFIKALSLTIYNIYVSKSQLYH